MEKDRKKKRIIIYSRKSPGPTNFYDPLDNKFLDRKITSELITSGVAEIEINDIPYVILLHVSSGRFFDTTKSTCISETEAKRLTDLSGVATLKIVLTDHSLISEPADETPNPKSISLTDDIEQIDRENKKEKLKEKLLLGATAAGGTTAVAAGAASVPFAMGFTSAGVAAGSAAAAIQSGIGSVAAGSWFAIMQSIAATTFIGTALQSVLAVGAVAGTVTSGVLLHKHVKKKKEKRESLVREKKLLEEYEDQLDDDDDDERVNV
ncbi:uncharacterized protein LOC134813184 [Bolinopsis microptera]|uniref:uncharacterized protein LOC134813184 n=1 Tax=Bolinopsis microptera TaxID=2820187 RepID=UPI003078A723